MAEEDLPLVTREGLGRMRVAAGASVRWDDVQFTPPMSLERVVGPGGALEGVRAVPDQSKTTSVGGQRQRHWAAFAAAATAAGDGWLAVWLANVPREPRERLSERSSLATRN